MNLATGNPRTIATLILHGKLELDEVPMRNRQRVSEEITALKVAQVAVEEVVEVEPLPPAPEVIKLTMKNTKKEIVEALDALGIEYSKSALKTDLFALLPS